MARNVLLSIKDLHDRLFYWIVSTRMERVAPEYAPKAKEDAFKRSMTLYGNYGIFGACRIEAATLRKTGGDNYLVKPYKTN